MMDIGNRHFGGWNHKIIPSLQLEQVFFEFRKLPCVRQAASVHNKWRQNLFIPVFGRMDIEHEVNEGPFQSRPCPEIKRKTGARNFSGPFKIEYTQIFTDGPVRKGLKLKIRQVTDRFYQRILGAVRSDGHRFIGDIRQPHKDVRDRFFLL